MQDIKMLLSTLRKDGPKHFPGCATRLGPLFIMTV